MRDTEGERHRQREKQAPCREPDAGLDPGTPGSCPEPKADAQPLRHPGVPPFYYFNSCPLVTRRIQALLFPFFPPQGN